MFAIQMFRNAFQSATCMLLSTIIVTASLTTGAFVADHAALPDRYSVTVTQLS
jgi:hypothetical protein